MKISLHGGPGDGAVINILSDATTTYAWPMSDAPDVLYFRQRHCGHADCPVPFSLPGLADRLRKALT
jgi:hypothetical protein